jgi:hypothetical protein
LGCGLRGVLRNHNVSESRSLLATWWVIGVGGVVTIIITSGMLGVRV